MESLKQKVQNTNICKEKKMDILEHTQNNSNREQHLCSHHSNNRAHTTMEYTTVPMLLHSQSDLV